MKLTPTNIILGAAVFGLAGFAAVTASAHELPNNQNQPAWRADAHAALESGDYESWRAAHQARFEEMVTQENFAHMQELHRLRSEGKFDEARQYAQENNLPGGHGRGHGAVGMRGMHRS